MRRGQLAGAHVPSWCSWHGVDAGGSRRAGPPGELTTCAYQTLAEGTGDTALAVVQGTGEQHRPERFAVLPILEDLDRIVAPLVDGGLVLPNCISVGLLAVRKMRVLPEQLVLGVAGQLDEGLICEDDRIAGQGGVGDEHRH